ncbi:Hypothetical predicted protein, partial [Marmota monax]
PGALRERTGKSLCSEGLWQYLGPWSLLVRQAEPPSLVERNLRFVVLRAELGVDLECSGCKAASTVGNLVPSLLLCIQLCMLSPVKSRAHQEVNDGNDLLHQGGGKPHTSEV